MEFETVKEALETLISVNDKQLNPESFRNVEDAQDFNYEILCDIADKLGMSDLYLGPFNRETFERKE